MDTMTYYLNELEQVIEEIQDQMCSEDEQVIEQLLHEIEKL